ncbi:FHA domain-containing protein [uncultured Jatrophihabitans sp.]|uniref:FHA domain-containing protein n=1 Tax=uncultured Jatrophihabitans sp. TaxID=1610747 RepID=UPI0035C9A09F
MGWFLFIMVAVGTAAVVTVVRHPGARHQMEGWISSLLGDARPAGGDVVDVVADVLMKATVLSRFGFVSAPGYVAGVVPPQLHDALRANRAALTEGVTHRFADKLAARPSGTTTGYMLPETYVLRIALSVGIANTWVASFRPIVDVEAEAGVHWAASSPDQDAVIGAPVRIEGYDGVELVATDRYSADDTEKVVGRDGDSDIVITDDAVSRRHCAVGFTLDGASYVRDLGSTNGTFVLRPGEDPEKIPGNRAVPLSPGDVVCLDEDMRFRLELVFA